MGGIRGRQEPPPVRPTNVDVPSVPHSETYPTYSPSRHHAYAQAIFGCDFFANEFKIPRISNALALCHSLAALLSIHIRFH